MSHPMSSVALRPINTHHPRPQRIFFLRRRSVSTCYPLSAPCPSVSQRHPNAPSSPLRKKKCDFGEEKFRGFVLQLFSVVHLLKVTALCFTYFRYKVADSTCATFLSNCRKRLFQCMTHMNVITVIQNHHSSTLIHQIKCSKNLWNVFLMSTGKTVPFRKGMPLKKSYKLLNFDWMRLQDFFLMLLDRLPVASFSPPQS